VAGALAYGAHAGTLAGLGGALSPTLGGALALAAALITGAGSYFTISTVLGIPEVAVLRARLRRKRAT
jgi:hypothetical protein